MKVLLSLGLFLFWIEIGARDIRIYEMKKDGELERSFVLKTNLSESVVIDCQSFIQGLRVGEYENAFTYLLYPQECDDLQLRISDSLKKFKNHCIEVDQDVRADYTCIE